MFNEQVTVHYNRFICKLTSFSLVGPDRCLTERDKFNRYLARTCQEIQRRKIVCSKWEHHGVLQRHVIYYELWKLDSISTCGYAVNECKK